MPQGLKSLRENSKANQQIETRPVGPGAKRQPSPEGLGGGSKVRERRRCGTTFVRGCRTSGAQMILGIDVPALPGWADVWLPALRAWFRFAVYFEFSRRL